MRTFIAVKLPGEIRSKLAEIQDELSKSEADVKWVKPENIHLTLKFLGNVVESELEIVAQELRKTAGKCPPFRTEFAGLGAFPNLRSPRVIWVGVKAGAGELLVLNRKIEEALLKPGLSPEEKEYKPHLTLGRVRSGRNRDDLIKLISSLNIREAGGMRVERVYLIKSELRKEGPIYTVLEEADLKE